MCAALFLFSICLGAFILVAFNSLANRMRKRKVSLKLALENLVGFEQTLSRSFSSMAILYGTFNMLYMFTKLIYSMGVKVRLQISNSGLTFKYLNRLLSKTSKVLIGLTLVVTTLDQLMRSNLTCCFAEDGIILEVTRQASKNTTLNRLFTEKSVGAGLNSDAYPNNCVLKLQKLRQPMDMAGRMMFVKRMYAKIFLKRYAQRQKGQGNVDFFRSPTLFDMVSVNYYRKGLKR